MGFFILILVMSVEELYDIFLVSAGATTDSRIAEPGNIFFALRGEHYDGNEYVENALRAGCKAAVIDNSDYKVSGKTIEVDNVLLTLQQLAAYHRSQFELPVLAITGSNGKTTTKELINSVLGLRFKTLSTRGNLNNHIGVPITLLGLDTSHEIAVIEMGANHPGEIDSLCRIASPTHGLITNIGMAHLEGFGSPEGVFMAKSELFRYLREVGGKAFVNHDSLLLRSLSGELCLESVSYGRDRECFVSGDLLNSGEGLELEVHINRYDETVLLKTSLAGSYNFENILAAVCTGTFFEIPTKQIKKVVEAYVPGNNRSQIMETPNNKLLLDAYNANPDSMKAAILNFCSMPDKNKSVILGDMLELGKYAGEEHRKVIELLQTRGLKEVIMVGEMFFNTPAPKDYFRFRDVDKLSEWLTDNPLRNRFILLKGSRGIQLERCITVL